jgi:hypothetical protein
MVPPVVLWFLKQNSFAPQTTGKGILNMPMLATWQVFKQ